MEHTKGEWLYQKDKSIKYFDDYVINVSGRQPLIARVFECPESIANARLIAAAPDLLAACELAQIDIYEAINKRPVNLGITWHELEQAIKKAK